MNIRDSRTIRQTADAAVEQRSDTLKRIALIYIAIISVLSLASSGVSLFLSDRISGTGGLGGMGLRSILSTVQTLLPWVQVIVLMGLQIGYCDVALRAARGQRVYQNDLFGGFRRFFPLLRAMILQGCLYFCMGMVSMYLAVYIFLLLPVSEDFQALIMPLLEQVTVLSDSITIDEATLTAASQAVMPALWIFAALFALVAIPTYYRYRMVMYRLIEQERPRALHAMLESKSMMRRNRLALLKLDLHLWWFYLPQLLIPVICYGDLLLPLLGITLPISDTAAYFLFLILSLALQAAVYYFFMNRAMVTYAVAYDTLWKDYEQLLKNLPKRPVRIVLGPKPKTPEEPTENSDHPWNDQY